MHVSLSRLLTEGRIIPELRARDRWEAIDELLGRLIEVQAVDATKASVITAALRKREQAMSTGIGYGIGVPHASTDCITQAVAALGRSSAGIAFDALDGQPVKLVVLCLVPQGQIQQHLHTMAGIAKLLQNGEIRQALQQAPDAGAMLKILESREDLPAPQPSSPTGRSV